MKRSALLCMLFVCALLLSACSSLSTPAVTDPAQEPAAVLQPAESAEPAPETTEAPAQAETSPVETTRIPEPENTESLAFSDRFPHMDEAILGVIYNDPFAYGTPDETEVWVRSESEESIHKHNAFAERSAYLGDLREE